MVYFLRVSDARVGGKAVENGHSSGSVTPAEASSGPSSRAGSVTNLSPVPSQSFSAKPFVPGAAEPRYAPLSVQGSPFSDPWVVLVSVMISMELVACSM